MTIGAGVMQQVGLLHEMLPVARFLYSSATGLGELQQVQYLRRYVGP